MIKYCLILAILPVTTSFAAEPKIDCSTVNTIINHAAHYKIYSNRFNRNHANDRSDQGRSDDPMYYLDYIQKSVNAECDKISKERS